MTNYMSNICTDITYVIHTLYMTMSNKCTYITSV